MTDTKNENTIQNSTEYQVLVLEKTDIDCIDMVRLMGDYHDQELPTTLKGRLHAHMQNCPICSEMYAGYSFVVKLAGELGQSDHMPVSAKNRLRARLNKSLGIELGEVRE